MSVLVHGVFLGVLASLYINRRPVELAEIVPIEANLDAPLNLFDADSVETDIAPSLVAPTARNSEADAPAKLETSVGEHQDFHDVNTGTRDLDATRGAPAKVGDGLDRGGGNRDGAPRTSFPGGLSGVGRRVVYVIDRSASMNKPVQHPAIEWAKDELIRSINGLPPSISFQVVFYSDSLLQLDNFDKRKDLIPATAATKERAVKFIRDLEAEGGTNHLLGVERCFELKPDVIFWMTDADDDTDDELRRLNNRITILNRRNAKTQVPASIHLIQLWHNDGKPTDVIREIPERNNGSYRLLFSKDLGKRVP